MKDTELKGLQDIELGILSEFIGICARHKLRYFLICGTCLGAVRHNGFIPWDDDIDIGMPRKDYQRFLDIGQKEMSDHLFVQNYNTEDNFLLNFTKIRNSKTTFIEKSVSKMDINHGVYIDIFPLDGVSANTYIRILNNTIQILCNLGLHAYYLKDNHEMRTVTKVVSFCMRILFSPFKLHKILDQIVERYDYDECELVRSYFGAWGEREMVPRNYFGNGCSYQFETILAIIPEQYDKYLTNIYGDYMTPPPKEQQVTHHETSIIDLQNTYLYYLGKRGV